MRQQRILLGIALLVGGFLLGTSWKSNDTTQTEIPETEDAVLAIPSTLRKMKMLQIWLT